MKTRTKVALIFATLNLFMILLFGLGIYYFLDIYSYEDFYKRLETRVRLSAGYNLELDAQQAEGLRNVRKQHLEVLEGERDYLLELTDTTSVAAMAEAQGLPVELLDDLQRTEKVRYKQNNTFYAGLHIERDGRRYLVIVSAENYYASHHLSFLSKLLLGGFLLGFLIIVLLSIYLSRHFFDPIKAITHKVRQISTENIHLRLDDKSNNHEIGELISTFNDLLTRIETGFETQKNFISNASHELATPLTAIIGEADIALLKERSPEEYREALQHVMLQAERLDEITKSLFFLAQTGYKGHSITMERLRMDEVVWEAKHLLDRLNPQNKLDINLSLLPEDPFKLKVKGNKQLLLLALSNVLGNACKYSSNKPATVFIASSDMHVVIMVKDQGIGIPESELPFIFDPFFRASNTRLFEGYGIGLPLARNIIHMHRGVLLVESTVNVGTTVQIKLPRHVR